MKKLIWNTLLMVSCVWSTTNLLAGEPLAFSPEGDLIAIGKSDGSIELVEVATGKLQKKLKQVDPPPHPASAIVWRPDLAFSPDGKVLASACGSTDVTLWDIETGEAVARLPSSAVGYKLTFSNTGKYLAGVGADSKVGPARLTIWKVSGAEIVRELTVESKRFAGLGAAIRGICFTESDELFAFETTEEEQRIAIVWNLSTGDEVLRTAVSSWSISSDGKSFVTRQADNDRHFIWDTDSGEILRELPADRR